MKKGIYSFLSLLLAALTVTGTAACQNGAESVSSDTTAGLLTEQTETTDPRVYPELPDADFEGESFRLLTIQNSAAWWLENFEFDADMTGDVLDDAVYKRNMTVEEKYNAVIDETREDNPGATMKKLIASGDSEYDVFTEDLAELASMASSSQLYNFTDIPHIDLTKPWWDSNAATGFSLKGKLFFMTGDYTLHDKYRVYCILFNKDIAADYNIENLYNAVDEGRWTLDYMEELARNTVFDVNGNGTVDYEDRYGLLSQAYDNYYGMCYGAGNTISVKDADDMPVINMYTDRLARTVEKLTGFICDEDISLFMQDIKGEARNDIFMATMFESGQALFYNALLVCAKMTYQNTTELDFGIIPQPKLDEEQEKYLTTTQYPYAFGIAIPAVNDNTEMTGLMLEALSAESKYVTMPAFYEITIKTKYTLDEKAPEMLDMIFGNIIYDVAAVYDWGGLRTILDVTLPQKKSDILSSEYAKAEKKIDKAMEKTLNAFFGE